MRRLVIYTAVLVVLFAEPRQMAAQVEVEVDPIAYAASGFSLHLATVLGSARVGIGAFGADIPEWLHGNDDWGMSFRGAGVKVDHLGSRIDGFFVGVDGGYMRNTYEIGGVAEKRNDVAVGVRAGYRLDIGRRGLYLSPWVGLSYTMGGADVVIGNQRFDHSPITVFPTVHIGWRF